MAKKFVSKKSSNNEKNTRSLAPREMTDSFLEEMHRMQNRMDSLFNSFWSTDPFSRSVFHPLGHSLFSGSSFVQPITDFWETEKEVGLRVEIPGVEKKDIQLNISDDRVEIKAEKKRESKAEKKDSFRFERSFSGFYRSFSLPSHADASKAKAKYENGILHLSFPKTTKRVFPARPIEIE